MEVLFHLSYYDWGKENSSLYRGVRSLYRGSSVVMIASETRTPKMLLLELKLFELRTIDSLSHLFVDVFDFDDCGDVFHYNAAQFLLTFSF